MPDVSVFRPGTVEHLSGRDRDMWTFTVDIDGKVGVIHFLEDRGTSEGEAANDAKDIAEKYPGHLGGIVSTDPTDDPGEETSTGDSTDEEDSSGDDEEGDNSGDDESSGDVPHGEGEESGGDDLGDDVGTGRDLTRWMAEAIARGLLSGVIPIPDDDGEGTGRRPDERLNYLIARVTSGDVLVVRHDPGEGLGDDVVGMDRERLIAIMSRVLARGSITPWQDDSTDGVGTGHPIPSLGPR